MTSSPGSWLKALTGIRPPGVDDLVPRDPCTVPGFDCSFGSVGFHAAASGASRLFPTNRTRWPEAEPAQTPVLFAPDSTRLTSAPCKSFASLRRPLATPHLYLPSARTSARASRRETRRRL